ncbi:protease inhibitor I42 family protein [Amycolatopsis sp. NPDC051903]|uniref:protease inhibitor I42 family protein n=1 Tax=Amycolatopsis sp. NPDC051903 TaxID=3363936 RepID=UPI003792E180
MHVLTIDDDGRELALEPGDEFVLRLPENPGTGYLWMIEPLGSTVHVRQESLDPALSRAGATGAHVFVLHADEPGETVVRLREARPWAPDAVTRRFSVTVRVG